MRTRLVVGLLALVATAALANVPGQLPVSLTDLPADVAAATTVQYWMTADGQVIHTPTPAHIEQAVKTGLLAPGTKVMMPPAPRAQTDEIDEYTWPMHGHNASQNWHNTVEPSSDPADTLQRLWYQAGGGSAWAPWYGYPVAAEGRVVYVDCYSGNMICRDIDDGTQYWSVHIQAANFYPTSPVIVEGTGGEPWVITTHYDTLSTSGTGRHVIAVKLSDGSRVWRVNLPIWGEAINLNLCRNVYYNGYVYCPLYNNGGSYTGGGVVRVNVLTGDTATVYRNTSKTGSSLGGVAVDATGTYGYYVLHNMSIANTWIVKFPLSGGAAVDSTPAITDKLRGGPAYNPVTGRVFCEGSVGTSGSGYMHCFDGSNLAAGYLWRSATSGGHDIQFTSIDDNNVYVTTQSTPGSLYAFKQSDGTAAWTTNPVTIPGSGPIYDGGVATTGETGGTQYLYLTPGYYGTAQGYVWVVDATDGSTVQFAPVHTTLQTFTGVCRPNGYLISKAGYGTVFCWEAPNDIAVKDHDVGVTRLTEPSTAMLTPGFAYEPKFSIKNYGINAEVDFPTGMVIQNAVGETLYTFTTLASLLAGDSIEIVCDTWNCPDTLFRGYRFTAYTALTGDQRPGNDQKVLRAMTSSDTIYSFAGASAPEIDGYMDTGEWDDPNETFTFDCSNVGGEGGSIQDPGSAYAWFKHDNFYMYMAFAMPQAPTRSVNDQIGIYIDENNDGAWPGSGNTTEGNFWFLVNGSGIDEVQYRYINQDGPGQPQAVPGAVSASSILNGYLVFECRLPLGTLPYRVNVNPAADTVGVFLYELDGSNFFGWWPLALPADSAFVPAMYGKLIFRTLQSGDVGVDRIIQPVGRVTPGGTVTPQAVWKNYGTTPMNFTATCHLEDPDGVRFYSQSQSASLTGGASITLTFPETGALTLEGGYVVKCTTAAAGDQNEANNWKSGAFAVGLAADMAVLEIVAPSGVVETMATVTPTARVKVNYAQTAVNADIYFIMKYPSGAVAYSQMIQWLGAGIGEESTFVFPDFGPVDTVGRWATLCSLYCAPDTAAANDKVAGQFYVGRQPVAPGWVEMKPCTPGTKPVKDGGWVAYQASDQCIYAGKGNKTNDFLRYYIDGDSWQLLQQIPPGAKLAKKGADGCADGGKYVYVVKGSGTSEFYRYDVTTDSWATMPVVPLGLSGKPIKGGNDMVYVGPDTAGNDYIYLLKGYKNDFMRFDIQSGTWSDLPSAPGDKYVAGSWVEWDGDTKLYVHQAKVNAMNVFDLQTGAWAGAAPGGGMPLIGSTGKSKKSKDGGSAAVMEDVLYAFKGGNTVEFWKYTLADSNAWSFLEDIPLIGSTGKKKKVKAGGDITAVFELGALFAFKGNKCNEFWRYGVPLAAAAPRIERSGVMASPAVLGTGSMSLAPNPLVAGRASLQYSLPRAGAALVRVTDVTGRTVLSQTTTAGRTGTINLDLRGLSAGVYLVRLDADGYSSQQKLVIQH